MSSMVPMALLTGAFSVAVVAGAMAQTPMPGTPMAPIGMPQMPQMPQQMQQMQQMPQQQMYQPAPQQMPQQMQQMPQQMPQQMQQMPGQAPGAMALPGVPEIPGQQAAQPTPAAQIPPGMVPLGPAQAYPPPVAWVPPANYTQGQQPYAPVPGYVPPGYPGTYAPQGYLPAPVVPSPPPSQADLSFQKAFSQIAPLTNEMITTTRRAVDSQQKIMAEPPSGVHSNYVLRSISLTLRPGETPPAVHLSAGIATVLTFSDQTGSAWPVTSVAVGNPQAYTAQEAGDKGKTNMIVVSPLTNYGSANLIVTLSNMAVPVAFSLETGVKDVDYRLDVGVPGRGPNAQYDIAGTTSMAPTNDSVVQAFLDGVGPKGSRKIKVSHSDVEAWKYQDMIYLRTPLELLSPAYIARARNVSGVNVYTLADTPVVIVSRDGRMTSVVIDR